MKRWIALFALLYPRRWREEFGDEFKAVLDDVRPGWHVLVNVLRGGLEMQIAEGSNWLRLTGAMAVVGAIIAVGLSFTVAPRYVSSAVVSVTPQVDPVRPTSPEVLRQRAATHLVGMAAAVLSRTELSAMIHNPQLQLYKEELERKPLEDVIAQMRHDIRIEVQPSEDGELVFSISFLYPDQLKVQAAVQALATRFMKINQDTNRVRTDAYRSFWGEMSAHDGKPAAPPPPVGGACSGA